MTHGAQFIVETFGEDAAPRFGWQIDPFGAYTVTHAHFYDMGFQATVIDRIPFWDADSMDRNHSREFLWYPSAAKGKSLEIFTHAMPHGYHTSVKGLSWDIPWEEPVNDEDIKVEVFPLHLFVVVFFF